MKHRIDIITLLLFTAARTVAGGSSDSVSNATISVTSNMPDVVVYIDSSMIGTTPIGYNNVSEGRHILRFVHPNAKSWYRPAISETLAVHAGDRITRTITFPFVYHITSEPYGATIWQNDSLLGYTPYFLMSASNTGMVKISKEGYDEVAVSLPQEEGELHCELRSRIADASNKISPVLSFERSKSLTPVYAASATAIVSGTVSAYFKIKADAYYNNYLQSGDITLLDKIHRYDRISGAALISSELSVLVLSYLLFSR
jgi:hypothetical protein